MPLNYNCCLVTSGFLHRDLQAKKEATILVTVTDPHHQDEVILLTQNGGENKLDISVI